MKMTYRFLIAMLTLMLLASCSDTMLGGDDLQEEFSEIDESDLIDVKLGISVNDFAVSNSVGSRAEKDEVSDNPETAVPDEQRITDVWVLQFTVGERLLIYPRYYEITQTPREMYDLECVLKPNVESIVYVVANTHNPKWLTGNNGVRILEELRNRELENITPFLIGEEGATMDNLTIPMEGYRQCTIVRRNFDPILIPVTRMYAKIAVNVTLNDDLKLALDALEMPYIMQSTRILTRAKYSNGGVYVDLPETEAANYGTFDKTRTLTFHAHSDESYTYVMYVPENLRGVESSLNASESEYKAERAPEKAFKIIVHTTDTDNTAQDYEFCPGSNNYNNYNIRRNCVYRVKIKINQLPKKVTPSANCFTVIPGETLSFYPYVRDEIGGGYNFEDYLTPEDPDKAIVTGHGGMKIIWQTKDCIGDNSNGDLVYCEQVNNLPKPSDRYKVYVRTKKEGNALVAAYNAKGEIVWSWHIWVTANNPGSVANAVVYSTYDWDSNGIKAGKRVPGYSIMPCNLGALRNEPDLSDPESKYDTYGMLFQWGRKDPFPPVKNHKVNEDMLPYDNDISQINVYDNAHKYINLSTLGTPGSNNPNELFQSVMTGKDPVGTTKASGIRYSIQHPTTFIATGDRLEYGYNSPSSYTNNGDWLPEHDDRLWGARPHEEATKHWTFRLTQANDVDVHVFGNYGEKSIFDPCPRGWRVSPGDLWFGFTIDGLNAHAGFGGSAKFWNSINSLDTHATARQKNGYHVFLTDWRKGPTTFFPTQGSRLGSGQPKSSSVCGNYNNATTDLNDRVNMLHFHVGPYNDEWNQINIFETQRVYYIKSVAGPIRCVRDRI